MQYVGLRNWREIVWYGWVIGAALITVNASLSNFTGVQSLTKLWGG